MKVKTLTHFVCGLIGGLCAAVWLGAQPTHAGTITVTLDFDRFDAGATSDCSLREAVQTANTNAPFAGCQALGSLDDDVIVFDPGVNTVFITRTVSGPDNDHNEDGDLDVFVGTVSGTLTVQGPVDIVVRALFDRAFDVHADPSGSGAFTLDRVRVSGGDLRIGLTTDTFSGDQDQIKCAVGGGALRVQAGVSALLSQATLQENAAAYAGGGVCVREGGALALSRAQVISNTVGLSGTDQVDWVLGGGGIWSSGPLTVVQSFVLGNSAVLSGGYYGHAGGGGLGVITGSLVISQSEVRANRVQQNAPGAEAQGGGIMALRLDNTPVDVLIDQVTVEGNISEGGVSAYGGGVALLQGVRALITGSTVISGNVLSATQNALGGGLAAGLAYYPSGYLPPVATLTGGHVSHNTATASAASSPGVVTPTVFGGGAFFGQGVVFSMTQGTQVRENAARYIGSLSDNTNGFGGGVSAFAVPAGAIEDAVVEGNALFGFRFGGGAGVHTGGDVWVRRTQIAGNSAGSSSASSAGTLGGGMYVNWGVAHVEDAWVYGNVITGTQFANGGGFGVDGALYITHTQVSTNTALNGGGFVDNGSAAVFARAITVTDNVATGSSYAQAGAWSGDGTVVVTAGLIAGNVVSAPSGAGGALMRYGGEFHVSHSVLRENRVGAVWYANGGAALIGSNAKLWLTATQVLSNTALATSNPAYVGGINVDGGQAWLRGVVISGNLTMGDNASGGAGLGVGSSGAADAEGIVIRDNRVVSASNPSAVVGGGGGVSNGAVVRLRRASVIHNQAAYGSGINTYGAAETHLLNATVSGNGYPGATGPHGIALTGTAYLTHTTVASNTGAGVGLAGTSLSLRAVALAHHSGGNCLNQGGSVVNSDASVSDDGSCSVFFVGSGALNNAANVKLLPLTFHAPSSMWYHPTALGSDLHDRVPYAFLAGIDQLGQPRPSGTLHADTGAFEFQNLHRVFAPIVRKP